MKNNREMEGLKYKRNKEKKNQGEGMWHVEKRDEVFSFLKYD